MKFVLTFFATVVIGGSIALAEPPATIDVGSSEISMISNTVIPIPLEVFAALDKLGDQNWNALLEKREFKASPDRSKTAILFGLAVSRGFIAVQAKDAEEVKRVGMAVQKLAGPLGVEQPVDGRIKAIMEELGNKNWDAVKQEFDRTRQTVLNTMQRMRDDDLASLVALGGWLGGTGALSSMLKDNYSPEASDLLNQSGLLSHMKADFDRLPASLKEDQIFSKIDNALIKLGKLMSTDKGFFTMAQVTQIENETHLLLDAIYKN